MEASEPAFAGADEWVAEPEPALVQPEPVTVESIAEPEPLPAAEPAPVLGVPDAELVAAVAVERPAVAVMEGVDGSSISMPGVIGESEHQPTGDELLAAAEAAEAADLAGDSIALRSLLLWTARAYAREGRFDAALDAIHRLLQRVPSDVDAHLMLVELYVARRWDVLFAEKLRLLGRLAELDNDEETRQRLCVVATRAFPEDASLVNPRA
jgi:tetratricopeptide (TPR) repeat protein